MNYPKTEHRIISIILLLSITTTVFTQSTIPYNLLTIEDRAHVDAQLNYENRFIRKIVLKENIVPAYRIQILINENRNESYISEYKIAYMEEIHLIHKKKIENSIMGGAACCGIAAILFSIGVGNWFKTVW